MKHTAMTEIAFGRAIKETKTYNSFEKFKQGIIANSKNINALHGKYIQAVKFGIDYLKQNPNIFANDIKMIEEVINDNVD
jgi:hypothetical protein